MFKGFKIGCRPIIGLDGCFLKGPYQGHLLSAVGRDGNNSWFPIAFAVVEAENKSSWTWFLVRLIEAIRSVEDFGWSFISDRQKGLIESLEVVDPTAEHRFCMRHMYVNLKLQGHMTLKLKKEMWFAATTFIREEFEEHMEVIHNESVDAYNYLKNVPPEQWTRSHFSTRPKCELLCNNLCESWNQFIMEARDKPILTMLEIIRRLMTKRIQKNKNLMLKHDGLLCTKVQAKMDRQRSYSIHCHVQYCGRKTFEVICNGLGNVVDIDAKTCTYRFWDVTGIPCGHAIAAMHKHKLSPEDFVDKYFHKETFMKVYEPVIFPLPNEKLWPKTGLEAVVPPIVRRQPGRPKKVRKRAPDEAPNPNKLKRANTSLRCATCKQYGHNKRTCKGPP